MEAWRGIPDDVLIPFLLFSAGLIVISLRFVRGVAPIAIRRWAEGEGFRIISQGLAGPSTLDEYGTSYFQGGYRVVVENQAGMRMEGVLIVGSYWWPSLFPERCPVVVRWEDAANAPDRGVWDRELDG